MDKIIYIADPEILAIPIIECNESLVDLLDHDQLVYGDSPEGDLSKNCYTKVRKSVFAKLCKAQEDLPNGWRFKMYDCFRSLEVQQILFAQEYQKNAAKNIYKDHNEIFHATTRLVSPVINLDGSTNVPPHNTGGAVDLEIIDRKGGLVDMGMDLGARDWCNVEPDICLTNCSSISKEAKHNRRVLFDVMIANDFINYPTEWWHFSYGDRYWAYHQGKSHAFYGSADNLPIVPNS